MSSYEEEYRRISKITDPQRKMVEMEKLCKDRIAHLKKLQSSRANAYEHEYNMKDSDYDISKISDREKLKDEISRLEKEQETIKMNLLWENRRSYNDIGNHLEQCRDICDEVGANIKKQSPFKRDLVAEIKRLNEIDKDGVSALSQGEKERLEAVRRKINAIPKKKHADIGSEERNW